MLEIMKIRLVGAGSWVCELEASVQECADLLRCLDQGISPGLGPASQRHSRREMVLHALQELSQQGKKQATLDEITQRVLLNHPTSERRNLDQVVRDLANKTQLVTRTDWGSFCLSDQVEG